MNILYVVMACFSLIAALDRATGNHLGMGKEFEKGIMILGTLTFSMVGMLLAAPLFAELLLPVTSLVSRHTPFDPSVIMGMLIANDMGAAPLSLSLASSEEIGYFNGLVVGAMMGATISFSIPFALKTIDKEYHDDVFVGMLCGLATIPLGCLVSGIMLKLPIVALLVDLIPVTLFSAVVMIALLKVPDLCVKVFSMIGKVLGIVIILGLALGIFEFLTGKAIIKGLAPLSEGMDVVINASAVMTGAFPLINVVSRVLNRPLLWIGKKTGFDKISVIGFVSSMATVATSYLMVGDMSKKGRIANLAFSVSGAFTFAGHLAFTMSINPSYVFPVIVGKLVSGFSSIFVAIFIYNKMYKKSCEN
ncbi:MAG: ethanolamine utilization protein EutH [Clostridia bacterium]|nr:ethanolamine utilization protein EutH [Clostridia bacterium]